MRLKEIGLNNFRSFANETIPFETGLSVLVGENNGGKSNIIDAIRLVTNPLEGRRDIYCEESDVRLGGSGRTFEIEAVFSDLSPAQQGRLLSGTTDDSLAEVKFGLTYEAPKKGARTRPTLWAGRFKSEPEDGCRNMIRHVYLPPLRDARTALASGNPTRIYALLKHFLGDREPEDVARDLGRKEQHEILGEIEKSVTEGLESLTAGVRRQSAAIGFATEERLIDIARDLRFKLADHGIEPEELRYSGHGFANLLYIAAIAVELERVEDADLTLFLVEEPEAHLHPQLQAAVLNFLEERSESSLKDNPDPNAPSGHLQVIVATHSPNLSAWVRCKHLVVVRTEQSGANAGTEGKSEEREAGNRNRRVSRCIPLSRLDIEEKEIRKVERYLDVTKSALLFGGRVLLVEGIAEALLLPVIAKQHVLKDKPEKLRIFRSSVFVPIDGVDFDPYVKLLLTPHNGTRIADRVVVVTDGDSGEEDGGASPGEKRKEKLEKIAKENVPSDALRVIVNEYSLEPELLFAGNERIMKDAFLEIRKKSEEKWDQAVRLDDEKSRARAIRELFKKSIKGDFAQRLAERIASAGERRDGDTAKEDAERIPEFKVPEYIKRAIESLVE